MAANAFTLFGTLNIESRKFESALNKADKLLSDTGSKLTDFETKVKAAGKAAESIKVNIDRLTKSFKELAGASSTVKSISVTLNSVGNAGNQAASATSKVGASAKKAATDSSQLQAILTKVESSITAAAKSVTGYAQNLNAAGRMSASTQRSIDKMRESIGKQKEALAAAIDAYTAGRINADQFAKALAKIAAATDKVSSKTKDANAKLADSVAAERRATAAKEAAKAAADRKRAAVEAARAASQREKAEAKAAAAASRQQAAAMREAASSAKSKQTAMVSLGKSVSSASSAIKGFGTDMMYTVSVPMAAFGAYAFKAATNMDALRNKLTAATGSVDQANAKFQHFVELARTAPGVFADAASNLFAAFKPMGLGDSSIDEIIKAFGRLKTAEENFDFDQFRLNMQQLYGQFFEMQDLKQALTFFPRFGELLSKELGLTTTDLNNLQNTLKDMQDKGILTFEQFALKIAESVNKDKNFALLQETLGNRFLKMAKEVEIAIAPLGYAIADQLEPALQRLVVHLRDLSDWFAKLPPDTKKLIVQMGGLAAVAGVVIGVIGSLGGILGFLIKGWGLLAAKLAIPTISFAKIGVAIKGVAATLASVFSVATAKAIAIITALIAAGYLLYKMWETDFGNIRTIVTDVFNEIVGTFESAYNTIVSFWEGQRPAFMEAWENLKIFGMWIHKWFGPVLRAIFEGVGDTVLGLWYIIKSVFKFIWEFISSFVMMIVHLIRGDFSAAFVELGNLFISVGNLIMGAVGGLIKAMSSIVTGPLKALQAVPGPIGEIAGAIAGFVDDTTKSMSEGIPLMESTAYELGQNLGDGLVDGIDDSKKKVDRSVQDLLLDLPKEVSWTYKTVVDNLQQSNAGIQTALADTADVFKYGNAEVRQQMGELRKMSERLNELVLQAATGNETEIAAAAEAYVKTLEDALAKPLNLGPLRESLNGELDYIKDILKMYQEDIRKEASVGFADAFKVDTTTARKVSSDWHSLGANARANLLLGLNPAGFYQPGFFAGGQLASGFTAGLWNELPAVDDAKKDTVKPPPKAGGSGKKAGNDFMKGLIEGLREFRFAVGATLGSIFDEKELRKFLKGNKGEEIAKFLEGVVGEITDLELEDKTTFLDKFQRVLAKFEVLKGANPQFLQFIKGLEQNLAELQKRKDAAETIKKNADALEELKDKLKDLQAELAGPQTKLQEINEFLSDPKFANLDPAIQAAIRLAASQLDVRKATEDATEALKQQADSYLTGVDAILAFVNLGEQQLTQTEQLEIELIKAAMAGRVYSEELIKAARAAATLADKNAAAEKAVQRIEQAFGDLGISIKVPIEPLKRLNETFRDTAGLEAYAAKLGITVEQLKKLIIEAHNANAAIKDMVTLTQAGEVVPMDEWDAFFQKVGQGMAKLKEDLPSFSDALATSVTDFVSGVGDIFYNAVKEWDGTWNGFWDSLKKGFADLVREFAAQMVRLLAMQAMLAIFGGFGTKGGGEAAGFGIMGGGAGGSGGYLLAAGGLVRGPGTGTSDSIPAMLSNGEYVMPAETVRKLGVGFFERLRTMKMPSKSGQMPTQMPSVSSVGSSTTNSQVMNNTINISVPPNAPAGVSSSVIQREVLTALQKSQRRNR